MINPMDLVKIFDTLKDANNAFFAIMFFLRPSGFNIARAPLVGPRLLNSRLEDTRYFYLYYGWNGIRHVVSVMKQGMEIDALKDASFRTGKQCII
jgi:hypothetical protein